MAAGRRGVKRGHEGVRAHDSCRFGACPPVCKMCTLCGFILTITGIIGSLNPRIWTLKGAV